MGQCHEKFCYHQTESYEKLVIKASWNVQACLYFTESHFRIHSKSTSLAKWHFWSATTMSNFIIIFSNPHSVKSIQIRSFFLVRISGVSVFISNAGKYEPEKNSVSEHFSRSSPSPCLTKKWKTMAWNKKGKKYQKIVLTCEHLHLYLWTHMY